MVTDALSSVAAAYDSSTMLGEMLLHGGVPRVLVQAAEEMGNRSWSILYDADGVRARISTTRHPVGIIIPMYQTSIHPEADLTFRLLVRRAS